MSRSENQGDNHIVSYLDIGKQALAVGAQVGCTTVLIVFGAVLFGLWLDRQFGTKPLLTVLLVLTSAPFSLFLTYRLAKRAVDPKRYSKNSNGESKPKEGETTGE
jgi:MFS-type transporter involved in bile tolerance (Atg22 family)